MRPLLSTLLVVALAVPPAHAATAPEKCAAAKVKAAGLTVYRKTRCHQKALLGGASVSDGCLAAADLKLTAAADKAERTGGCEVPGDVDVLRTAGDACVSGFAGAIAGERRCAAAKMKATGKKAYAKAKCRERAFLRSAPTPDPLCLAKAEAKFAVAIARGEALGTCSDTAVALEALVDACVPTLVSGATTTSTSEPPTTSTSSTSTSTSSSTPESTTSTTATTESTTPTTETTTSTTETPTTESSTTETPTTDTSTTTVESAVCGDGVCSPGETCEDCCADCGTCPPACGNGVCEAGESQALCPADCTHAETATFPVAVEQDAVQQFIDAPDCTTLPVSRLFQIPVDHSAFTSLSGSAASSSVIIAHMPAACCAGGTCGGGLTETLTPGAVIGLTNGLTSTVLAIASGCVSAGLTQFTVPVIPAGANPNATTLVVGFAQIIIDHVQSTGSASQKGIYAKARCANGCGDGTCSAVESCTSCPADCGGCPATCP